MNPVVIEENSIRNYNDVISDMFLQTIAENSKSQEEFNKFMSNVQSSDIDLVRKFIYDETIPVVHLTQFREFAKNYFKSIDELDDNMHNLPEEIDDDELYIKGVMVKYKNQNVLKIKVKNESTNARDKNRGRVCSSLNKDTLVSYIVALDPPVNHDMLVSYTALIKSKNVKMELDLSLITSQSKMATELAKPENIDIARFINTQTIEDLDMQKRIFFFFKQPVIYICNALKQWFTTNNLLFKSTT